MKAVVIIVMIVVVYFNVCGDDDTDCNNGDYDGANGLSIRKLCRAQSLPFPIFFSVLEIHAFERLLGPCMDIMKRNITNYEDTLNNLGIEHADLR